MASKSTINVRILGDNKDLKGALDDSESQIGAWAGRAGTAVAAGLAAAGALGAVALTKGFTDALDAEAGVDRLQAQLGISETQAAELGAAASAVYRDAWGESLAEVQTQVGNLSTSFEGLGADQVEDLTAKAIALGDAFEIDTAQGIQTASELVSSGLAASAEEAFDLLTVGLQKMPAGIRDELLAASNEYGDFFADLGFSGEETFGLLTDFAEDGQYGIDKVGDAVKEFSIRATDMSDASSSAFDAAGLNAEDMAAKILAGGDTSREAMDEIITGLLSIEDPVEQSNAAIALFGTPLEDLSVTEIPEFLTSLQNMGGGFGDVSGAAGDMADTLGGNTASKIEAFKREALGRLADFAAEELIPRFEQVVAWFEQNWPEIRRIGGEVIAGVQQAWEQYGRPTFDAIVAGVQVVVAWFEENWPKIQATIATVVTWLQTEAWPVIQQIIEFVRGEFDKLVLWTEENWPRIQATIESVVEAVRIIIEAVVATITWIWEHFGDDILALAENAWENIKNIVEQAINVVLGIINTVTSLIKGDWEGAWEGIKQILDGVWEAIKGIVSAAVDQVKILISAAWEEVDGLFSDTWNGLKDFVGDVWDGIADAVSDGVDAVVGFVADLPGEIGSAVSGAFDGIWTAFKGVINDIADAWNGLEFTLPKMDLGPFGEVGGWTIGIPEFAKIPRLATGGVITSPTLAVVGEYAGARSNPEIVAPRSMMVDAVREAMGDGGGAQVGMQVMGDLVMSNGLDAEQVARGILFQMAA